MFIYYFTNPLFSGQRKCIVSSFPIPDELLELVANYDNDYPDDRKWKLTPAV